MKDGWDKYCSAIGNFIFGEFKNILYISKVKILIMNAYQSYLVRSITIRYKLYKTVIAILNHLLLLFKIYKPLYTYIKS